MPAQLTKEEVKEFSEKLSKIQGYLLSPIAINPSEYLGTIFEDIKTSINEMEQDLLKYEDKCKNHIEKVKYI